MITLIVIVGWLLGGLATFRRVGYMNEYRLKHGPEHDFRSICHHCRCVNCDDTWGNHYHYRSLGHACQNFVINEKTIHPSTGFLGLFTMALWPGFITFFLANIVQKKLGLDSKDFFVPPPAVESRKEKARRELEESEARNAELQETIARLERENNISQILPKSGRHK